LKLPASLRSDNAVNEFEYTAATLEHTLAALSANSIQTSLTHFDNNNITIVIRHSLTHFDKDTLLIRNRWTLRLLVIKSWLFNVTNIIS
jgi:hypothetical protein